MPTRICRDTKLVHPKCGPNFRGLEAALHTAFAAGRTKTHFRAFETYRSPQRQLELIKAKPPVTKATMWQSAHQYGLAVDFVPFHEEKWSWDEHHEWSYLAAQAKLFGLSVPYTWDRPHVESPLFRELRSTSLV